MSYKQHGNDEQSPEWVFSYCANLRFLGVQMGHAIREFENSWLDAQNRTLEKKKEA